VSHTEYVNASLEYAHSMRRMVLFGFLFMGALMSGLTILAYLQINDANNNITSVIELNNKKTTLYYSMRHLARERTFNLHRMLATKDSFLRDEYRIRHSNLAGEFIATREELMALPLSVEETLIMEKFAITLNTSQPIQSELAQHAIEGKDDKAMALVESVSAAQEQSLSYLDRLVNTQKKRNMVNLEDARDAYQNTVNYLALIAISMLIFGSIITAYIFNKITHSARAMLSINRELQTTNYKLEDAQKESEAANIAKSDFLANMSHEIRTPMNAIFSVIGILRSGKLGELNETGEHMVNMAHQNSTHLLTLINDLLDFSKIDAEDIKINLEPVNIRDEVNNVTESLKYSANEKGLQLNTDIDPRIETQLLLDPARLYQVLINLVSNAIKYTQHGSVSFNIRLIDSDTNPLIRFEIIDTGMGIPKESHSQIFEKFYQVDASSTRKTGGTGLGLSICNHLVKAMSGKISMESTLGQGSRFWFDIPYVIPNQKST